MLFSRNLIILFLWGGIFAVLGVMLASLLLNRHQAHQWPLRLLRFLIAISAGLLIFIAVYFIGGALISRLEYSYNDRPLLRLAHLVCVLGAYPAGMAAAVIFRTRNAALFTGILMVFLVHFWIQNSYLAKMVFNDPGLPLNGDFALTNIALILVSSLLGGDSGLKATLEGAYRRASDRNPSPESRFNPSLTSGGD